MRNLWRSSEKAIYERMRMMTQKDRIRKYLEDFGSITPKEAMEDLGIMRLAARISEMVKDGEQIIRETEMKPNRYGQITRYARYRRVA